VMVDSGRDRLRPFAVGDGRPGLAPEALSAIERRCRRRYRTATAFRSGR
jgi:hypothetical protein